MSYKVIFGGAMRPGNLRFKRSLAEAFPSERAYAMEHYLSNHPRHRLLRLVKRLLRWVFGRQP